MAYDIGATAMSWPVLVVAVSAGSLVSIVLLVVMCSCCHKTNVPEYKAKVEKNVVAKENLKRNTPQKKTYENRRTRPPRLIFNGTPVRTGGWNEIFAKDGNHIPRIYNQENLQTPCNPPDVILHAAIVRPPRQELRTSSQPESISSPTDPNRLPSPSSRPSTSIEELNRQNREEKETENGHINGTVLTNFPTKSESSQEENRNGSILVYKPRRDVANGDSRRLSNLELLKGDSRNRISSSNDPVTSRIEEMIVRRGGTPSDLSDTPGLPRFDRTSGEWDNVPKPGHNNDTPPPLPSRNYSVDGSDLTDCSEIMPTPVHNRYIDDTTIEINKIEKQKLNHQNRLPSHKSSEHSRRSSRSSAASKKNGFRSPEISHPYPSRHLKGSSPGNDSVFTPNENPAYVHGSSTPAGHTPIKDSLAKSPDRSRQRYKHGRTRGLGSDGQYAMVDETQRHKRVEDLIRENSPRRHEENKSRPVYLRPKPYYPYSGAQEKRYSDTSDYNEYFSDINKYYADQLPDGQNPYFFRSRWSAACDNSPDRLTSRQHHSDSLTDESHGNLHHRDIRSKPYRKSRDGRFNSELPDHQPVNSRLPGKTRSPGYSHQYSSNDSSPDLSQRRRSQKYSAKPPASPPKPRRTQRTPPRSNRQENLQTNGPHNYNSPKQSPVKKRSDSYHSSRSQQQVPLDAVVEQHGNEDRDVLVSPNRQQNYPGDVARIRRGLQKSHLESTSRGYNAPLQSYVDGKRKDGQVMREPVGGLAPENNYPSLAKRASSDYGSLIDILYRYRQNVRKSREKEKPTESPESRLRFERQKLKSKLKEELEPREMQSKNVEMVIETLLYLCETESGKNQKKRSWQRENNMEVKNIRPRPNSLIVTTPTEEDDTVAFFDYDAATKGDDDYARIRSMSESRSSILQFDKSEIPSKKEDPPKIPERNYEPNIRIIKPQPQRPNPHKGFVVPQSAPPETHDKEFAFPSVDELNHILRQNGAPPPVPPRLNRVTPPQEEPPPPPIAPRKFRNLPPTPEHEEFIKVPLGNHKSSESVGIYSQIQNDTEIEGKEIVAKENSKVENGQKDPDYAKIRKKINKNRRKSLPSMNLTESEARWLLQSGGIEQISGQKYEPKVKVGGRNKEVNTRSTRMRERAGAFLHTRDLPAPPDPPQEKNEDLETTFSFDDIPINENTDAEDIIKALERKMSLKSSKFSPSSDRSTERPSPMRNFKQHLPSDSEMGTWSSVTSSELPATPYTRARLIRYEGKSPTNVHTPSQSPVFLRHNFHTPPPDSDSEVKIKYPREPMRMDSLTPSPKIRPFQTAPASPLPNSSRAVPSRKYSQPHNVLSRSSPNTPARFPKNQPQFTPRKQYPRMQRSVSPNPASTPASPVTGLKPNLGRRFSKFKQPKIPFMSKKFVQSTAASDLIVPIDSDRRRVSRTGEIIYLPEDDDYSEPLDAITNRSNPPYLYYSSQGDGSFSPNSPIFNITDSSSSFYPVIIKEEGDYAIPVNQPPSELLQQKIRARSMENLADDLESAV